MSLTPLGQGLEAASVLGSLGAWESLYCLLCTEYPVLAKIGAAEMGKVWIGGVSTGQGCTEMFALSKITTNTTDMEEASGRERCYGTCLSALY